MAQFKMSLHSEGVHNKVTKSLSMQTGSHANKHGRSLMLDEDAEELIQQHKHATPKHAERSLHNLGSFQKQPHIPAKPEFHFNRSHVYDQVDCESLVSKELRRDQIRDLSKACGHFPTLRMVEHGSDAAKDIANEQIIAKRVRDLDRALLDRMEEICHRCTESGRSKVQKRCAYRWLVSCCQLGVLLEIVPEIIGFLMYSVVLQFYAHSYNWDFRWSAVNQDTIYYPALVLAFLLSIRASDCMLRYRNGNEQILCMEKALREMVYQVIGQLKDNDKLQRVDAIDSDDSPRPGVNPSKPTAAGDTICLQEPRKSMSWGKQLWSLMPARRTQANLGTKQNGILAHLLSGAEANTRIPGNSPDDDDEDTRITFLKRRYFIHEFRRLSVAMFACAARDLCDSARDIGDLRQEEVACRLKCALTPTEYAAVLVTHSGHGHVFRVYLVGSWLKKLVEDAQEDKMFSNPDLAMDIRYKLNNFNTAWLRARQIAYSAMPSSIVHLLWLLANIISFVLAWEYVSVCRWMTWLPTLCITISFHGIVRIASTMENPFGFDEYDIDLAKALDAIDEEICLISYYQSLDRIFGENTYRSFCKMHPLWAGYNIIGI